jgi:hypothetical protein
LPSTELPGALWQECAGPGAADLDKIKYQLFSFVLPACLCLVINKMDGLASGSPASYSARANRISLAIGMAAFRSFCGEDLGADLRRRKIPHDGEGNQPLQLIERLRRQAALSARAQ